MELLLESTPLMYIGVFLFGLLIGSFLNAVIYRTPRTLEYEWRSQCSEMLKLKTELDPPPGIFFSESLCTHCEQLPVLGYRLLTGKCSECGNSIPRKAELSRSNCRDCGHEIKALENIPVLSYLVLRGKCSECKKKISFRYPLTELITAIAFTVVIWHFGPSLQGLAALTLTAVLIALTGIDFDTQYLPDNITLPLMWIGIALNFNGIFTDIKSSLLGAACGYLVLWGLYQAFKHLRGKEGMGYGDFKLMAALGAWLGWEMLPGIIAISSIAGALAGIMAIIIGRLERDEPLPFGPFIAIAGWITLIWGEQISSLYLRPGGFG